MQPKNWVASSGVRVPHETANLVVDEIVRETLHCAFDV
jgi:hypothetical protein